MDEIGDERLTKRFYYQVALFDSCVYSFVVVHSLIQLNYPYPLLYKAQSDYIFKFDGYFVRADVPQSLLSHKILLKKLTNNMEIPKLSL